MQPSSRVQVIIAADGRKLEGELIVPGNASGVVAFAHGSGSSRHSPRNQSVARALQQAALATLLHDLLEEEEAQERHMGFDIEPLALRLLAAARWLGDNPSTHCLAPGYLAPAPARRRLSSPRQANPGRLSKRRGTPAAGSSATLLRRARMPAPEAEKRGHAGAGGRR